MLQHRKSVSSAGLARVHTDPVSAATQQPGTSCVSDSALANASATWRAGRAQQVVSPAAAAATNVPQVGDPQRDRAIALLPPKASHMPANLLPARRVERILRSVKRAERRREYRRLRASFQQAAEQQSPIGKGEAPTNDPPDVSTARNYKLFCLRPMTVCSRRGFRRASEVVPLDAMVCNVPGPAAAHFKCVP